jgi:hypothetical protein
MSGASESPHPIGGIFGLCTFLAWGCGGNVTGNGPADASSSAIDAGESHDASQPTDV